MKKIALALGSLLVATNAFAETTIQCKATGSKSQLSTSFSTEASAFQADRLGGQSAEIKTDVNLGTAGAMEQLSQQMTVKVTVWPQGTLNAKKEVRSYEGFYVTPKLKTGFSISQSVDAEGNVADIKNVFGLNGQAVGTCTVTEESKLDCPEDKISYSDKADGGPGFYCAP